MEIVNTHQAEAWNGYEGRHWAGNRERYEALVGEMNGPLFAAAAIEPGHRVLDVGCGTGQTPRIAARTAYAGHAAGFGSVTAEPIESEMVFGRDPADAARFVFGWGPVRHWVRDAGPSAVAKAEEAVAEALRGFAGDDGVRLRSPSWVFRACSGGA